MVEELKDGKEGVGDPQGKQPRDERGTRKEEIIRNLRGLKLTRPTLIVTHKGTHPDEFEAIRLLREELPKLIPGVDMRQVPVELIDNNNAPYRGKTGEELLKEGVYIIGCGGPGPWNHHPHNDFPDFCSADQVAVALGVENRPEYRLHLKRVRINDLGGGGPLTVIAEYLRFANVQTAEEFEKAYTWIMEYVDLFIAAQTVLFSQEMETEFERTANLWTFTRNGAEIPVVTINGSAQPDIIRFAQQKTGAEIVILRGLTGNVQILTFPKKEGLTRRDFRKRVGMEATLAMLRHMEQRAMSCENLNENWDDLTKGGFLFGWYNLNNQTALNGSRNAVVNPTLIPLSRIEEAVAVGNRFRPGQFPWEEWLGRVGRKDLSLPMFE